MKATMHKKSSGKNPLSEVDKQYIIDNHKNTTVLKICEHLKRTPIVIYRFMDQNGLEVFTNRPELKIHRIPQRIKAGYFDIDKMGNMF